MPKCAKCGKRGLFLRTNQAGICPNCAKGEYGALAAKTITVAIDGSEGLTGTDSLAVGHQEAMNNQERLFALMLEAEAKHKKDKDDEALIKVYEEVFCDNGISMNSHSRLVKLSNLYLNRKMYDKNWSYLNYLTQECASKILMRLECSTRFDTSSLRPLRTRSVIFKKLSTF